MFCTNCGNRLGTRDNFCGKCGRPLSDPNTGKPEEPARPIVQQEPSKPTVEELCDSRAAAPSSSKVAAKTEKTKEKLRADLKKLLEEKHGREVTEVELDEADSWLRGYADLMYGFAKTEWKRQQKLKERPKGFHLEGQGYTCFICGGSVSNEETWYDRYGIKCLVCQKAIDARIIPATAAKHKDSWYSAYDLQSSFNIDRHALRRLTKERVLKSRTVPSPSGRPHVSLFFIKDNRDTLPPKKLVESQMVKVHGDGKGSYRVEPWYRFVDPREHLKGYKIMDHLQVIPEKNGDRSKIPEHKMA